jgi:acetyl esterase/lipase
MTTRKEYIYKIVNGVSVAADVYFRKAVNSSKLPIGMLNPPFSLRSHPLTSRAVALHFHGGNFTIGSKEMLPHSQSEKLLDLGFVVVSANYRLAPTITVFEGPVKDALDAYKWSQTKLPELLLNDAGLDIDGSSIVTFGHSCGGTLALLMVSTQSHFYTTVC